MFKIQENNVKFYTEYNKKHRKLQIKEKKKKK